MLLCVRATLIRRSCGGVLLENVKLWNPAGQKSILGAQELKWKETVFKRFALLAKAVNRDEAALMATKIQ